MYVSICRGYVYGYQYLLESMKIKVHIDDKSLRFFSLCCYTTCCGIRSFKIVNTVGIILVTYSQTALLSELASMVQFHNFNNSCEFW